MADDPTPGATTTDQETGSWKQPPADGQPSAAIKEALRHVGELKEYAGHFVAAKWDGIKLSVRNAGLYAALGVVGLIAFGGLIVTAIVLLCVGLAGAIGAIFNPDRPWAGSLIVGVVILAAVVVGMMIGLKKLASASRKRTVDKYESRLRHQRVEYGHDANERAMAAEAERSD